MSVFAGKMGYFFGASVFGVVAWSGIAEPSSSGKVSKRIMVKLSALQVRRLLGNLCSHQGFCLPPQAVEALANNPPTEVLAFTDAVFRGEGLDPFRADSGTYRGVRDVVAEAFHRASLVVSDEE